MTTDKPTETEVIDQPFGLYVDHITDIADMARDVSSKDDWTLLVQRKSSTKALKVVK